jgi:hypothetical protein
LMLLPRLAAALIVCGHVTMRVQAVAQLPEKAVRSCSV